MSLLSAFSSKENNKKTSDQLKNFLDDFSIEVMPRTASKLRALKRYCHKTQGSISPI